MATDAKKHTTLAPGEVPSRAAIAAALFSIDDIIPVANGTEANQVGAAVAAAGQTLASNPVFVSRADARGLHRIEYSYDGTVWLPFSGILTFASKSAADTWATSNSSYLTVGDMAQVGATRYLWTGTKWAPERSVFLARRANAQALAGGWNVIDAAYGAPSYNDLGAWSAGALTIERPGLYRIGLMVRLGSSSNPGSIQITRNSTGPDGVTCLGSTIIESSTSGLELDIMADLAANDVIRGLVFTLAANTIDAVGTRGVQLSLELIRPA